MSDSRDDVSSPAHSLDQSLTYNEVNMTVTVSKNCEENVSSTSSSSNTPAPATPIEESLKPSGSPIMRGLQNMLSMFRSSQSPIVAGQNQEDVCTPEINTPRVSGSGNIEFPVVASTPLPSSRKEECSLKRSSPLKESIIFNDELSNELQWNNDSTILFSKERIPIHKLFLPQILTTSSSSNDSTTAKTEELIQSQSTLNQNLNMSSEPMDVSFNESIINHQNGEKNNLLNNNISGNVAIENKAKSNFDISLEPMDVSYNESVVDKTYTQQMNNMPSFSETRLLNETNNNSVFLECETSLYVEQNESELLRSFNDSINTFLSPQDSVEVVVKQPLNNGFKGNNVDELAKTEHNKNEEINQTIVGHDDMNNTTYWENLDVSNLGNVNESTEIFLDATTNFDTYDCESNYENESTIKNSSNISEYNNTNTNSTINTVEVVSDTFLKKLHDPVNETINNIVKTAEAKVTEEKSFINSSINLKQFTEGKYQTNNLETIANDKNIDLATTSTIFSNSHDQNQENNIECHNKNNIEIKLNKDTYVQEKNMPKDINQPTVTRDLEAVNVFNNSNITNRILKDVSDNILDNSLDKNEIFKTICNEGKIESINGINVKVDYETLILNKKYDNNITNMCNNYNIDQGNIQTVDIHLNEKAELVCNKKINELTTKIENSKENKNDKMEIQAEKSETNKNANEIKVINELKDETERIDDTTKKCSEIDDAIHVKIVNSEIDKNSDHILMYNANDNTSVKNVNENSLILNEIFKTNENKQVKNDDSLTINTSNNIINENKYICPKTADLTQNNTDLVLNEKPTNIISPSVILINSQSKDNIGKENIFMNETVNMTQDDFAITDDLCNKEELQNISLECIKNPFSTKTKLRMSPCKLEKCDFNIDNLQNSFATISKIPTSPPPAPNLYKNITIDINEVVTAIENEDVKEEIGVVNEVHIGHKNTDIKNYHVMASSSEINSKVKTETFKQDINTKNTLFELQNHKSSSIEQSVYVSLCEEVISTEINTVSNTVSKDVFIKDNEDTQLTNNDNVSMNLEKNEDTEIINNDNVNVHFERSEDAQINNDNGNDSSSDVNTEDEDTLEGPFLDDNDFIDLVSDNEVKIDNNEFNIVTQTQFENMEPEEMFIDAAAYDFLMNKNGNPTSDNGKESLFLKFDPLCAKKVTPDGIANTLLINCDKRKISNNINVIENMDSENENNCDGASEESFDDLNVTVAQKPTMAVMPAVNNDATGRQQITPTRSSRQSFGSPAIALIDRLLTISASNTPVRNNRTITHTSNYEQEEANKALTELKLLLTNREQDIENLRSESYELKSKLTFLENQMNNLETINKEKFLKINELNVKLESTTKKNKNMVNVVEEFERTIASLMSEIEQEKKEHAEERFRLINERDEQSAHLASMEVSFSDLHSKYEKSKQVILGFKANEDSYKKSLSQFEENLQKMQNTYELLKQHATGKLNRANEELEKINRTHESEVLKMNTMIKRKELHIISLEETLNQKVKANEELTAICDELLVKVG